MRTMLCPTISPFNHLTDLHETLYEYHTNGRHPTAVSFRRLRKTAKSDILQTWLCSVMHVIQRRHKLFFCSGSHHDTAKEQRY